MTETSASQLFDWLSTSTIQVSASIVCLLAYFVITRYAYPKIEQGVVQGKFKSDAALKAIKVIRLLSSILTVVVLFIVWGFDFSGLLLITTSIITVTGIALFANWSILSNVTAFIVLLLQKSYRRGNYIRIIDADNYIEGYIAEVNVFNTRLITEGRETIIYPNSLLISRPMVINPKIKWAGVGKISNRSHGEANPSDEAGRGS